MRRGYHARPRGARGASFSLYGDDAGGLFLKDVILTPEGYETLKVELEAAGSFLDLYDDAVDHEWLELGRVLDELLLEERDLEIVLTAARAALDCFETAAADPTFMFFAELNVRTA